MTKVFLSYKKADKKRVFPIVRQLESRLGTKFWIDMNDIVCGGQFSNMIVDAINRCEVFLYMHSNATENNNPQNDWTFREMAYAGRIGKRIVLIDLDGHQLPGWLMLRFPGQLVVAANDDSALDKLADDLRCWLHLPEEPVAGDGSRPTGMTAIDLELPSGTKWASCNVDALSPEESGGYYAWGETEAKEVYDWNTYIHCDGEAKTCHCIGETISGSEYDVASKKCGEGWRLPTIEQVAELLENCFYERSTLNGTRGGLLTSKINGNSIFIPFAGYRKGAKTEKEGSYCGCWSGTRYPGDDGTAYGLYAIDANAYWHSTTLCYGHTVRPVTK